MRNGSDGNPRAIATLMQGGAAAASNRAGLSAGADRRGVRSHRTRRPGCRGRCGRFRPRESRAGRRAPAVGLPPRRRCHSGGSWRDALNRRSCSGVSFRGSSVTSTKVAGRFSRARVVVARRNSSMVSGHADVQSVKIMLITMGDPRQASKRTVAPFSSVQTQGLANSERPSTLADAGERELAGGCGASSAGAAHPAPTRRPAASLQMGLSTRKLSHERGDSVEGAWASPKRAHRGRFGTRPRVSR